MTDSTQPETVGESPAYWTHEVGAFPGPVAVTRMAQLIDFDDRLYETARVVYRFLISWYHGGYGDAFMSMNHVAKTMKHRAPAGAVIPSRSAVHRAIIALMETGWVVRTFKGRGRGKGASRYVPVMNVLELAAQGKFPEPSHHTGTVQPSHLNGTVVSHATGTVEAQPSHATGIKTLLHDPRTDAETCKEEVDFAPPAPALAGGAAAKEGFDELFDAYGVRQDKADARRAYERLAPDADMHARMVEAARAWRRAAGDIERMRLRRWIEEERYDEDPRSERKPRQRVAANQNTPKEESGPRRGMRTVDIIYADTEGDGKGGIVLNLTFSERDKPVTWDRSIIIDHPDYQVREKGHAEYTKLCRALNLPSPEEPEEFLGAVVIDVGYGGKIEYHSPAEAA